MAKIRLTKTAVESVQPQAQAVELLDTVVSGFLCKITLAGRRVFMLQYRTNIAVLMEKLAYQPAEANNTFGVLRKMFNLAEV